MISALDTLGLVERTGGRVVQGDTQGAMLSVMVNALDEGLWCAHRTSPHDEYTCSRTHRHHSLSREEKGKRLVVRMVYKCRRKAPGGRKMYLAFASPPPLSPTGRRKFSSLLRVRRKNYGISGYSCKVTYLSWERDGSNRRNAKTIHDPRFSLT